MPPVAMQATELAALRVSESAAKWAVDLPSVLVEVLEAPVLRWVA